MSDIKQDQRAKMLTYLINTDSFKQDLMSGDITFEILNSWGITIEVNDQCDGLYSVDASAPDPKLEELQAQCSQRGARMQILFELIYGGRPRSVALYDDIRSWFDKDGVPLK